MAREKSNEKVQIILEAARVVLAQEGYTAATINQIASQAGVSRGLLHYYFKNKEELLIQVFRHNMEDILEATSRIFADASSLAELAQGLSDALQFILEWDPNFFTLFMESWTLTRQGPEAMALLKEIHARFRQAIIDGLNSMAERGDRKPGEDLQGAATVLTALVDGLGLQMTIEPELSQDQSVWRATQLAILLLAKTSQ